MANWVMRGVVVSLWMLTVGACTSKAPVLTINPQQKRVLDASLLAAGIVATDPEMTFSASSAQASAILHNTANHDVTVYYRFYWYDAQGLDLLPFDEAHRVNVPVGAEVRITAERARHDVHQVRLHLFM